MTKGRQLEEITGSMTGVAEGVATTMVAHNLAQQFKLEMPITEKLYRVLYEGLSPKQAALELMDEEKMDEQAAEKGAYFMERLRSLGSPLIKEIRGKGLLIGMEFKPEAGKAKPYLVKLMKEGLLAKDTHEQTVRFAPPIIITMEEIDQAVEKIARVICTDG